MQDLVIVLFIFILVICYFFYKSKKKEQLLKEVILKDEFEDKMKDLKERMRISDEELKEMVLRYRDSNNPTDTTKH